MCICRYRVKNSASVKLNTHPSVWENMKNANARNALKVSCKNGWCRPTSGIMCLFFSSLSPSPSIMSCCIRRKIVESHSTALSTTFVAALISPVCDCLLSTASLGSFRNSGGNSCLSKDKRDKVRHDIEDFFLWKKLYNYTIWKKN